MAIALVKRILSTKCFQYIGAFASDICRLFWPHLAAQMFSRRYCLGPTFSLSAQTARQVRWLDISILSVLAWLLCL